MITIFHRLARTAPKLFYTFIPLSYIDCVPVLIFLLAPFINIVFEVFPIELSIFNILMVIFFPWATLILQAYYTRRYESYMRSDILSLLRMPVFIKALLGLFNLPMKWKVTSRKVDGKFQLRSVKYMLFFAFFNAVAVGIGYWKMRQDGYVQGPLIKFLSSVYEVALAKLSGSQEETVSAPISSTINDLTLFQHTNDNLLFTVEFFFFAGGFALYQMIRCIIAILHVRATENRQNQFFRFNIEFPLLNPSDNSHLTNIEKISEEYIISSTPLPEKVLLILPSGPLELALEKKAENQWTILWSDQQSRDILNQTLYSIHWHWEQNYPEQPRKTILRHKRELTYQQVWCTESLRLVSLREDEQDIIIFEDNELLTHSSGDLINVMLRNKKAQIQLGEELPINSVCSIHLDGTRRRRFSCVIK